METKEDVLYWINVGIDFVVDSDCEHTSQILRSIVDRMRFMESNGIGEIKSTLWGTGAEQCMLFLYDDSARYSWAHKGNKWMNDGLAAMRLTNKVLARSDDLLKVTKASSNN